MECKMTEEELIQGLLVRKEDAFKCLYIQCFHLCKKFILNNNGTFQDAEDTFQDAILALLKGNTLDKFQANVKAKVSTLLITIVRNIWLNRLRKDKKPEWVELDDNLRAYSLSEESIGLDSEKVDLAKTYEECMKTLRQICQQVILMTFIEKKTDKEIAEIFDWKPEYVKVRRFRCIEELRECSHKAIA